MVVLAVGVLLPGGRLPGPEPTTTTSTTATTLPEPTTTTLPEEPDGDLGFDAAGFLDRWNSVPLDPDLRAALLLPSFDAVDVDSARVRIAIPEVEIDWTIDAELDPATGSVRRLLLTTPLSTTDQGTLAEQLAMVMVITVVESFSTVEEAGPVLDDLLDLAEAAPEVAFSVESRTDTAAYVFSLSAERGLELGVHP